MKMKSLNFNWVLAASILMSSVASAQVFDENARLLRDKRAKAQGQITKEAGIWAVKKRFNDKGFRFSSSYMYTRKVVERSVGENSDYSIYNYALNYSGIKGWDLRGSFSFFNDTDNFVDEERQLFLSGASLNIAKAPYKFGKYMFRPSMNLRLPVGKYTVESESLQLGVGLSGTLILPRNWIHKKVNKFVGVRIGKNFHEFDTRLGDGPNTSWSGGLYGGLSSVVYKNLVAQLSGSYGLGTSYASTTRAFYSFSQSLSYQYSLVNFTVGHSLESSVFAPDGVTYYVRAFDEDRSRFFVSVGLIF